MGNRFVHDTYGLLPEVHDADLFFIDNMMRSAAMYGLSCEESPKPVKFLQEGDTLHLGTYAFSCIHTPGHSPGSISFYQADTHLLISGDVLFYGSIGRTDLPMGNFDTLMQSIKNKLFVLPEQTKVYSGHGQATDIGFEKMNNPYVR
jgi:glyoxylase-like metal-dependent hydrolase (beta-lactamase superfamily II)